ncbi:reverse transcriptase (RNA-dependent DNA polymerase) domain-containing protein [Phthorimaea operculella]|nr:reverse transcriptase (RNA-dependent DNA polymerase) domain-containing protein [Phthorimaea operculella]
MEEFMSSNNFQVICTTETHLSQDKLDLIHFENYKLASAFCRTNYACGGIAILLENHLNCVEKNDINLFTIEYVIEICAIEIPEENLLIITVYWNGLNEDCFDKQLKLLMCHLNNKYKKHKIIIGGDFNINVLKTNEKSKKFLDFMSENNFSQHIKEPTRICPTIASCLDLIFTNYIDVTISTKVEELGFSDHKGTMITTKRSSVLKKPQAWYVTQRQFTQKNIESFKIKLKEVDWHKIILPNKNINENYNKFHETLIGFLNICMPKIRRKIKPYKKIWLTKGIKKACRNKRLFKILVTQTNNKILRKYYKIYEKLLKQSVSISKRNVFRNKMKKSKNKNKTMWNIVNERTNKKATKRIRGMAHKWLESYLRDREQIVEIEYFNELTGEISYVTSDPKTINASIPQGSVIGCLLFLAYINDFPKVINETCVLFADDISLLISCKNSENLDTRLHDLMEKTVKWLGDHNLDVNYEKTKLMTFHPHQKRPIQPELVYEGTKIKNVNEFTLLGLEIDTHVTWKPHIKKTRSKLSRFSYALREIKKTTDLDTALTTYYAYAYSWLCYGVILWGNSTDVSDLFTRQKTLIRILANIKNTDSCKPYFAQYKILTLPCIYIMEICKFVRKYKDFFTRRSDLPTKYTFRNNRLMLPSSRLTLHSTSPYVMAIKVYNKLPKHLQTETKDKLFIRELKTLLLNKCYYSVEEYLIDKF